MRFKPLGIDQRILARKVIHSAGIETLCLVDVFSGKLAITPFDFETSLTIFVDGVVVCMLKESVSDELLSECISECSFLNTEKIYNWLLHKNALGNISDPSAQISFYQID